MTTSEPVSVQTRIEQFLAETGVAEHHPTVVALTGDASDRRYVRVHVPDAPSMVLAIHPGPITFDTLPFVNVARLLAAMPVPVPAVLAHSDALGIIALQDLGDVTLQAHLGAAAAAEHDALYREAVTLIETMQRRGAELRSPDYLPYGMAFDVEKLIWELQFFTSHFVEAYRGQTIAAHHRETLAAEYATIAGELAAEPRVLCHRDYHSRNLMLHRGRLYLIDFQDARMGPDTYDLVSLLRDSYVDVTDAQIEHLIACFLARRRGDTSAAVNEFRRRFDLMAVQRNLKALGTFGFQAAARDNAMYLQYIPRTLAGVRANLVRYPRFAVLHDVLATYVEELR